MGEKKKRGRPSTGFDKKAYDRERIKQVRAGTWVKKRQNVDTTP